MAANYKNPASHLGKHAFQPGQSGNPAGRARGSRNRRTQEVLDKIKARGDLDAIEYMSSVVTDTTLSHELRLAAAIAKAPYEHSKCGLTPQPQPLVFVSSPIAIPFPKADTLDQVRRNVERLSDAWRRGQMDEAAFKLAVDEQRVRRDTLVEAGKLQLAQGGPRESTVFIQGGLDAPPGTNIIMPGERTKNGMRIELVNGESVRDLAGMVPPVPVIPPEGSPLAEKPEPPEPPPHLQKPPGD
jgi:hypothetical protein